MRLSPSSVSNNTATDLWRNGILSRLNLGLLKQPQNDDHLSVLIDTYNISLTADDVDRDA